MSKSAVIRQKYINYSNSGEMMFSDELIILQHLVKKFNFINQADYAKKEGISSAGAKKRLESGKEPIIIIGGTKYVIK
jgi:hypothetical protein